MFFATKKRTRDGAEHVRARLPALDELLSRRDATSRVAGAWRARTGSCDAVTHRVVVRCCVRAGAPAARASERALRLTAMCKAYPAMEALWRHGVAFYNADLPDECRKIIEKAFVDGVLAVICATSGLSTGVNLPARRVIICDTHVGVREIDTALYRCARVLPHGVLFLRVLRVTVRSLASCRQMAGRAGRTGLDVEGEAIVMCSAVNEAAVRALMTGPLAPLRSNLTQGVDVGGLSTVDFDSGVVGGLTRLILEAIATRMADISADLRQLVSLSMLCALVCMPAAWSRCSWTCVPSHVRWCAFGAACDRRQRRGRVDHSNRPVSDIDRVRVSAF